MSAKTNQVKNMSVSLPTSSAKPKRKNKAVSSAPKQTRPSPKGRPLSSLPQRAFINGNVETLNGFYDPQSTTSEVRYKVTDYFDSTGDIATYLQNYLFDPTTSFISSSGQGSGQNLLRVDKFSIYALPAFDVLTSNSSFVVAFGLPVRQNETGVTACQQTTLLTPTSVSNWVKVGHWSSSQVFRDSIVSPAYNTDGLLCLGAFAVLNPDDLAPATVAVQYRVEYIVSQTLPTVTSVRANVVADASLSSWNEPQAGTGVSTKVLVDIVGMGHST